jgi:hypothetical protein
VAAGTTIDVRKGSRASHGSRGGTIQATVARPHARVLYAGNRPPSLDTGLSPDPNMIYVGSVGGVLYAVEATF